MSSAPSNLKASFAIRLPWLTLAACGLAVGVWFWPGAFAALTYERSRILQGEVWRLVTCHWVHFSGSHLFWNLVVLAAAGWWLEHRQAAALRWTLALAPLVIGTGLLLFEPSLLTYAGISGVASGVLVALAVHGLRADPARRFGWVALLVLFAVKVGIDFTGQPLNPALAAQAIRSVPLAHLLGAAVGAGAAWWTKTCPASAQK